MTGALSPAPRICLRRCATPPPTGHVEIEIDRLSERRKSSRKQARPPRSARLARAEVRHRRLTLPATLEGAEPVAVSVVHVRERVPPRGEKAVEWFLLTSLDVDRFESVVDSAPVGRFRTLPPMRSRENMRTVIEGIETMEREETAYWLGMAMHWPNPRRALAALRVLSTGPRPKQLRCR